jgi:hypothetical protein
MTRALKDLLNRCIDYSGMFPPARLSAEDAVEEYVDLSMARHRWLLHRFSVPITQLFDPAIDQLRDEPVAVIGRRTDDWDADRAADAEDLQRFIESGRHVSCYECVLAESDSVESTLRALQGFQAADEVLVELDATKPFPRVLDAIADADAFGAKLRTGPVPPPVETVATFIWECVALELPFKLTAGLHQPLSRGEQLGFVNVLGATALALSDDLSVKELSVVLASRSPADWDMRDAEIGFRDWSADLDAVADAKALFASFGSCSVLEPVHALNALGWYE